MTRSMPSDPFGGSESGDSRAEPSDERLMQRVADGDETALRLLVDRWEPPLLSFLARTLGDPEEARELAQETFLRVYKNAGRYRAEGRFRAWLFRIAGNLARSRLRRKKLVRWLSLEREPHPPEPIAPNSSRPDAEQERLELGRAIEEGMQAMPERQRMAFALRSFENLAYREIAAILDCSESAVESLLVRATRRMQAELRARGFWEEI